MSSVQPEVEPRTLRAATDHMTVIEEARSLFSVTTESGSEYTVDLREPACTCPDFEHRSEQLGDRVASISAKSASRSVR
jgi:hypothetical protein